MSDTPINLNKVRKARARAERRVRADRNAAAFGLTKAKRDREAAQQDLESRRLDGHERDEK